MNKSMFNPSRLKDARIYRKLTIEELSTAVSVKKQAISQFENNKCSPDLATIQKIATTLQFPLGFFFEHPNASVEIGNTYFRALFSSNKKSLNAQRIKTSYVIQLYHCLSKYINFVPLNIPIVDNNTDVEKITLQIRNAWQLGTQPIKNMVSVLERNGFIVTEFSPETREIDAFNQYCEINGISYYCIVLENEKVSAARRQFSCAHELGHIFLHEKYDDLNDLNREDFKKREIEANKFASAFLLPRDAFYRDIKPYCNKLAYYIELKKKWNVSIGAMIMRAKDIDAISDNQYQYLIRQWSKNGWREKEPLDDNVQLHHPRYIRHAVNLLKEKKKMSGTQIMNLFFDSNLSLPRNEVEGLLFLDKNSLLDSMQDNVVAFPTIK